MNGLCPYVLVWLDASQVWYITRKSKSKASAGPREPDRVAVEAESATDR
jgi:hypothetical protein